ncbi:MAG: hypothetical protein FWC92_02435 [Defluviitaleaceae bacterium]|nr:hypothetical protein [Defluviitaleaceae bacterium]
MDINQWTYEPLIATSTPQSQPLSAFAYDGCFFYLANGAHIYIYNSNYEPINRIKISQPISALCYDNNENCFWATDDQGAICKLDLHFEVQQRTNIGDSKKKALGLSYFCVHDSLLVAYHDTIVEICKHGQKRAIVAAAHSSYKNILGVAPYFAIAIANASCESINFHAPTGEHTVSVNIPPDYCEANAMQKKWVAANHTGQRQPQL